MPLHNHSPRGSISAVLLLWSSVLVGLSLILIVSPVGTVFTGASYLRDLVRCDPDDLAKREINSLTAQAKPGSAFPYTFAVRAENPLEESIDLDHWYWDLLVWRGCLWVRPELNVHPTGALHLDQGGTGTVEVESYVAQFAEVKDCVPGIYRLQAAYRTHALVSKPFSLGCGTAQFK